MRGQRNVRLSMKVLCMKNAQANYVTNKSGRENLDAPKCYDSITENKQQDYPRNFSPSSTLSCHN